jgi:hypothetical protein
MCGNDYGLKGFTFVTDKQPSRALEKHAKHIPPLLKKKTSLGSSHKRLSRRTFFWATSLGLLLALLTIVGSIINSPLAYAANVPSAHTHPLAAQLATTTAVSGPRVSPDLTP